MALLRRILVPIVVVAFAVTAALVIFGGEDGRKQLTAFFPRTVSLYEGSDVVVLGVPVGTVDTITPQGTEVEVTMSYDSSVEVPADAQAVIVSPAIVGDRFVQLTPVYEGGEVMADGAVIEQQNTAVPLELDQIYKRLDQLTVALGPTGANANGALSDLLEVTAKNFGGQGEKFNQTIEDFSRLSETLEDNKEELFGSTAELQKFITTLAENDGTVRRFNQSLGRVSEVLAGQRQELASALANLGTALDVVNDFVKENRGILREDIRGLTRVTQTLVDRRSELDEILRTAPLALNNLVATYNPNTGTLDTNANLGQLEGELENNPGNVLCSLVASNDTEDGQLCSLIKQATSRLPRSAPFENGSSFGVPYDPSLGGLVKEAS